ncbi:MAG: response regulator transcription factor [Panacibacter sp.]
MPNLLIADDHTIIRTGLKMIIENFLPDCKIDEAHDGDSAFEKISNHEYDLTIMDINMPNTNSFELIKTILILKPETKILMYSMNTEEIYAKRFLKIGVMGYLRKDESESEIKKAINLVLNNKRYISVELTEKLVHDLYTVNQSTNPFDKLSPREFEIVQHLIEGESVGDISQKLKLHTSTVGTYKARIFEKLKCNNVIYLSKLTQDHNVAFCF